MQEPEQEPSDPIFDWNAFDLANRLLDGASDEPIRPEDFGPYHFLDEKALGSGAMSDVWRAHEDGVERQVAIKLLHRTSEPDVWAGREIKRLGALEFQYIARLYHHGVLEDGTPWLAMEYVDGERLDEYCQNRNCSIRERIALFHKVCEGVQYAHGRGIIHGDLKPSNIRVKKDGEPKLLDFGLAEQFQSPDGTLTQSPSALGFTPAYAAPEQFRGEPVSVAIDVYALGVILYELLTGKLPFEESQYTYSELKELKTSERKPDPPSACVTGGGGLTASEWRDMDALCMKAMESDSNRRYQTVEVLLQDLDRFRNHEPLQARIPQPPTYRLRKFIRRRRAGVLAAAAVFAVAAAVIGVFTWRLAAERDKAQAEAARSKRIEEFMVNVFQGGDKEAGPADELRVVTLLDRATKDAQSLKGDPRVQSDFYLTLGTAYQALGKPDRADPLLESALDLRKSIFGTDHGETGAVLLKIGSIRDDQAQLPEAEKVSRQAVEIMKRHLPPSSPARLEATIQLAHILARRGDYTASIRNLTEALAQLSGKDAPLKLRSRCLSFMSDDYFYLGDFARADTFGQQALALDRTIYGDDHPAVADLLVSLGRIQMELGQDSVSEKYYREALEIERRWYGLESPNTADIEVSLVQVMVRTNRDKEAEPLLQRALANLQRAYPKPNSRVALALGEAGHIASHLGKFDEGELYFKRQEDLYILIHGPAHQFVGTARANRAWIYYKTKQYARAEDTYRNVIQLYRKVWPGGHRETAIAEIFLGDVLTKQRRYREAEVETLNGYEILVKQSGPDLWSITKTRERLVKLYDALKQPEKGARFRAELAAGK